MYFHIISMASEQVGGWWGRISVCSRVLGSLGGLLPPTALDHLFDGKKRSAEWTFLAEAFGHSEQFTSQGGGSSCWQHLSLEALGRLSSKIKILLTKRCKCVSVTGHAVMSPVCVCMARHCPLGCDAESLLPLNLPQATLWEVLL